MEWPETRPGWTPCYFLSGPTASGKTEVAHRAAERFGGRVLSVDSMMVYRGMDIGTAKPTEAERVGFDYAGLDLVDPGVRFSTGAWLRAVRDQLDDRPTFAVGGTGLYFRALTEGLTPEENLPALEPGLTADAMRAEICRLDAGALARLSDPENPRRLARALQWLRAGRPLPSHWNEGPSRVPVPVLRWPVAELNERIGVRAGQMFERGLLEEAAGLQERFGEGLGTAAQAIGYREAFAVLAGSCSVEEAVEAVTVRTRRYAKRQRTWFRNQMASIWVEGEDRLDETLKLWQKQGPFWLNREHMTGETQDVR